MLPTRLAQARGLRNFHAMPNGFICSHARRRVRAHVGGKSHAKMKLMELRDVIDKCLLL